MSFFSKHILSLQRQWSKSYGVRSLLLRLHLSNGRCHQLSSTRGIQLALSGHDISNYEQERKNVTLEAPQYFNFARDFLDQWAKAEQVS